MHKYSPTHSIHGLKHYQTLYSQDSMIQVYPSLKRVPPMNLALHPHSNQKGKIPPCAMHPPLLAMHAELTIDRLSLMEFHHPYRLNEWLKNCPHQYELQVRSLDSEALQRADASIWEMLFLNRPLKKQLSFWNYTNRCSYFNEKL